MNVRELIRELKKCDMGADVILDTWGIGGGELGNVVYDPADDNKVYLQIDE